MQMSEVSQYLSQELEMIYRVSNSHITQITRFEDGWETEIFSFLWTYTNSEETKSIKLVLRILQGDNTNDRINRESEIMKVLHSLGINVPKVILVGFENSTIGKGHMVMEFVEGKLLLDLLMSNIQEHFPTFIKAFADLHNTEWKSKAPHFGKHYEEDEMKFLNSRINHYRQQSNLLKITEMEPLLSYLEQTVENITLHDFSLLHNDFHPSNIIANDSNQLVILDWSGADVGDFRFDLGWTYMLVTSFIGEEYGTMVLQTYEQQSGRTITDFEFFEGLAYARRYIDLVSVQHGNSNLSERVSESIKGPLIEMTKRFLSQIEKKFNVKPRNFM